MSFMSQESGMSLSIPQKFRQSAQELKNVHTLTGVSVLLAMSVVISFMASVRITESIKIGLGYLITALLGMLYGPFTAALAAGAGDIIKYLLKPDGAYFFGFTLRHAGRHDLWLCALPRAGDGFPRHPFQNNHQSAAQLLPKYRVGFLPVWNAVLGSVGTARHQKCGGAAI